MKNRCLRSVCVGLFFAGMFLVPMMWVLGPGIGIAAPPYTLTESWSTTGFSSPESALYDAGTGYIYVPNFSNFEGTTPTLGDGYISRLNPDGSADTDEWVGDSAGGGVLNDPKGMGVYNGMLYVADMNQLKAINLATGQVENTYPVSGTDLFLNDVTVDSSGNIYVSDSNSNAIYRLDAGGTTLAVWLNSAETVGPNGLFAEEGRLIVGTSAGIFAVDLDDKTVTTLVTGVTWVDGIWGDGLGNYFFSDGVRISLLKSDGSVEDLLFPPGGSADLSYAAGLNLILSPDLFDTVTAYRVGSSTPTDYFNITGLTNDITQTPQAGEQVTFTVTATGTSYKFWYRAGYGTPAYGSNPWVVMQDYSTNNTCTYAFPSTDHYVVVVHGAEDPNNLPAPIHLIGLNVMVGAAGGNTQLTGLTANLSGTPRAGDSITFTATATGTSYKFWYRAGYGTSAYGSNPWVVMQDYSTTNTCTYTFPSADHYVVVVHGAEDPNNLPNPISLIGMSLKIESQ